jgi:hypothetical protein
LIDVVVFQRDGIAALRAGRNPYALTFPNIYPPAAAAAYYGANLGGGGRLPFGFVYPPLSLLLAAPGAILGGDFRYAQLVATTAAGALIAAARGGKAGLLAAALWLYTPRGFFVIEQGWTEPFVVALLALVVFAGCRQRPWLLAVALGLLVASKQYLVLALPLVVRLTAGRRRAALLVVAVGSALVVTAPLACWDWRAFGRSVLALQFAQPFRPDALSVPAALAALSGVRLPSGVAFAAAGGALLLAWRAWPATPSGFASAVALLFFVFFAFNKQAFCNYYTLVLGALAMAVGALPDGARPVIEG